MVMDKTVCVFGGTGFIGHQVVRELCRTGWRIKIASRVPEQAFDLKPCGSVGQVSAIACDGSPSQVAAAITGCEAVINLVGILYEKKRGAFHHLHVDLPRRIAEMCKENRIERFIHFSALGVDHNRSRYGHSKKEGEEAVLKTLPTATILRPSVVFGPGDHFFNLFATLATYFPALPLIGGGKTKFQPIYVGDVADAVMAVLKKPQSAGKIYELGGPEILTFKEIYQRMFVYTQRPRLLIPLPYALAKIKGAVLSLLPRPPLTADQVDSLRTDNIVSPGALTLETLGIIPAALDAVLPTYLNQYRAGGRFADKKAA